MATMLSIALSAAGIIPPPFRHFLAFRIARFSAAIRSSMQAMMNAFSSRGRFTNWLGRM